MTDYITEIKHRKSKHNIYWLAVTVSWFTSATSWWGYAIDSQNTTHPNRTGEEGAFVMDGAFVMSGRGHKKNRLRGRSEFTKLWAQVTTLKQVVQSANTGQCVGFLLHCRNYIVLLSTYYNVMFAFPVLNFCDVVCHCLDQEFKKWLRFAQLVVSLCSNFEK